MGNSSAKENRLNIRCDFRTLVSLDNKAATYSHAQHFRIRLIPLIILRRDSGAGKYGEYPKAIKFTDAEMAALKRERHAFHGKWDYTT